MIKKSLTKRYQLSYESKDSSTQVKVNVLNFKAIDNEVNFFSPVEGKTSIINILPYEIKSKNHPLVKSGSLEIGDRDYMLDVWTHKNIGPTKANVICLKNTFGKPCPICEQAERLKKEGDEKGAGALKASRRVFYNVQDLKEPDKVKIFETSHFLFEKELIDVARSDDGGFVDFADIEDGKEIRFKTSKEKVGGIEYKGFKGFSFSDRSEEIPEEVLENVISFDEILNVPTYEEVEKYLSGNDDEEELKPVEKKTSKKVDYEEDEEEQEEEKPVKKPSKKVVYEEDEDDLLEDDEDFKPVKKPSRKFTYDDEDDDFESKKK